MLRKRAGRQLAWTPDDLPLLDEAMGQLDGPPFTFGHVVVDEAQDLSPMALRMIARRCPSGSLTILGDLAQSTAPAATSDWATAMAVLTGGQGTGEVAELTIGYRVPAADPRRRQPLARRRRRRRAAQPVGPSRW